MSHFAEIDEAGTVLRVIVAEQDFVNALPGRWVQTSYNGNIRKNFAGIGFTYDESRDAFIAPKPCASWVLNEEACDWEAPVQYPQDGVRYRWDEETVNWVVANGNG